MKDEAAAGDESKVCNSNSELTLSGVIIFLFMEIDFWSRSDGALQQCQLQ